MASGITAYKGVLTNQPLVPESVTTVSSNQVYDGELDTANHQWLAECWGGTPHAINHIHFSDGKACMSARVYVMVIRDGKHLLFQTFSTHHANQLYANDLDRNVRIVCSIRDASPLSTMLTRYKNAIHSSLPTNMVPQITDIVASYLGDEPLTVAAHKTFMASLASLSVGATLPYRFDLYASSTCLDRFDLIPLALRDIQEPNCYNPQRSDRTVSLTPISANKAPKK